MKDEEMVSCPELDYKNEWQHLLSVVTEQETIIKALVFYIEEKGVK